ncbi:cadmium-translocating P-type ATPase [Gammaproteobacteria bacterium LSUCC0112]|nr:cadmium-translocating P-type ATPase [Gammaproteobacteria bacterium LSUCC0112]
MASVLTGTSGMIADDAAQRLCFHCQSPVPSTLDLSVTIESVARPLCCTSCQAAVQFIHDLKLESYYQYREQCDVNALADKNTSSPDVSRLQKAISTLPDGRQQLTLLIPDLRCVACVWLLEQVLGRENGVDEISVNYATRRLRVVFDSRQNAVALAELISSLGYSVRPDVPDAARQAFSESRRSLLLRMGIAGIGMMQVMMFAFGDYFSGGEMEPEFQALLRWASMALTTPVVLYSAWPFHRAAFFALKHRTLTMDVPVSLAILAAWLLSVFNTVTHGHEVFFDTACMFTFFLLIGRYAELLSRFHFQQSQDLLEHLLPDTVLRLPVPADNDALNQVTIADTQRVALDTLMAGDVLWVLPGDTIPADGFVLRGQSGVSEAAFTGEALPQPKQPGARVLAGSVNHDGELLIRVKCTPGEFVIRQIARLHEQAGAWRPRWAQLADRTASWFIAAVLLIAAGAGIYWYQAGSEDYLVIMLTVLVVSCPCALSLATPVAYSVATTTLRNHGVVIKHGAFLERAAETNAVVFDKTGTLTEANLKVTEIVLADEVDASALSQHKQHCLALASALEAGSEHPIAHAFDAPHTYSVANNQIVAGCGVMGNIEGQHYQLGLPAFALETQDPASLQPPGNGHWIVLSKNRQALAWFCLQDTPRTDASAVVNKMHELGIRTAVFTGDQSMREEDIRALFAVQIIRTGMSPQDKVDAVRDLQQSAHVMMVGDGINDTAAMAAADTSLAVTPRDSFVQNSADATLLNGSLMMLPAILTFAKKCRTIIRQNVTWSVIYNFTVIPFTLMGMVPPWLAALGMSLSSILVVSNAGRLRWMER